MPYDDDIQVCPSEIRACWHAVYRKLTVSYYVSHSHVFVRRVPSFDPKDLLCVRDTGESAYRCAITETETESILSAAESDGYQHRTYYFMFSVVFTHIFLPSSLHCVPLVRIVNEFDDFEPNRIETSLYCSMTLKKHASRMCIQKT